MSRFGYGTALDLRHLGMGAGVNCNYSTYWNGSANVNYPFVDDGGGNMVPETGPLNFDSTSPVDTLKSTFSFDPDQDWSFDIEAFVTEVSANDRIFVIYDSNDLNNNFIRALPLAGGQWRIQAGTVNTPVVTSDFTGGFVLDEWKTYGLRYDKATSKIYATVNGVDTVDDEIIDFTGVTLNTIVIGTDIFSADSPSFLLRASNSDIIGNTNFIGRLRTENDTNGNKFFSDATTPAEWVVTDSSPTDIFFPHIGLYNTVYLVSDTPCAGNNLQLIDGVAQQVNGVWQYI